MSRRFHVRIKLDLVVTSLVEEDLLKRWKAAQQALDEAAKGKSKLSAYPIHMRELMPAIEKLTKKLQRIRKSVVVREREALELRQMESRRRRLEEEDALELRQMEWRRLARESSAS